MLPQAELLDADLIGELHAAYQRTYIERDARLAGDVNDWQTFARFFRMAAALTAQEINGAHLGRELGLSPQTARRWLDLLVATYQWHEIPAWSGNTVKRVSKRPKGYMADSGTACSALRLSSPPALADHPALGAIFETAVVAEVRKLAALLPSKPYLHHWRSHGGAEVDLILERDGVLYPLEIKATTTPSARDLRGIHHFRESHAKARIGPALIVAPTESIQRLPGGDLAIPWNLAPVT
jgi:predicted AAA+ superfamily ATPase